MTADSTNSVTIGSSTVSIVEYDGQRVVTFKMIDDLHERPEGTARRNYNANKHHLTEGEDYFVRNSSEARKMGFTAPNGITLLTEPGYLMLVKSFTDDLAWKVQKELVRSYFRTAAPPQPPALDLQDPDTLRGLLIDYATRTIEMKKENAALAPKAAALDALAGMDGQHNLRLSAAQCQMKERDFTAALEREGWIYRDTRTGRLMVYARARDAGWMTVKNVTIQHRSGEREGVGQPMMTQRGLAEIQRRLVARPFTRELEPAS